MRIIILITLLLVGSRNYCQSYNDKYRIFDYLDFSYSYIRGEMDKDSNYSFKDKETDINGRTSISYIHKSSNIFISYYFNNHFNCVFITQTCLLSNLDHYLINMNTKPNLIKIAPFKWIHKNSDYGFEVLLPQKDENPDFFFIVMKKLSI